MTHIKKQKEKKQKKPTPHTPSKGAVKLTMKIQAIISFSKHTVRLLVSKQTENYHFMQLLRYSLSMLSMVGLYV